jgi:ABC-2 type transport system permease protein
LYLLFDLILRQVRQWELVGTVAQNQIFVHFFFVLAIMLAFSNAILAFSSLYGRDEAGHLMTMPVHVRHVVFMKWLEGLFLSSWSFMLLGIPLMLAVGVHEQIAWYFYPLFIGHFFGFVVIPATVGVLFAWAVAMFVPRKPLALALWIGGTLLLVVVAWFYRLSQAGTDSDAWLRQMIQDLSFTGSPLFPSAWTAQGVIAVVRGRVEESAFYLLVVAANATFLVWITVNLTGATWSNAFSRAQHGRAQPTIRNGWVTELVARLLFFYLPRRLTVLMLKDIRTFARDATQWMQMAIMLGLLFLYAVNLHRLPVNVGSISMQAFVAFLNLMVISLILATFTSRFVYPLLSLESQQLWLLGLLPVKRVTMLLVKFLFALTITGLSGLIVMGTAVVTLGLPLLWAQVNIAVLLGICVGLCGLSVGLGARYPVLGQRNPARIASGLGGSINLIASMLFVGIEMFGVAALTINEVRQAEGLPSELTSDGVMMLVALLALSVVVTVGALWVGARHFARLEY